MKIISQLLSYTLFSITFFFIISYLIEFTHDAQEYIKYGEAIITAHNLYDLNFYSWIAITEAHLPHYNRFEYGFALIYYYATKFFDSLSIYLVLATITLLSKKLIFDKFSYYPKLSLFTYLLFFVVFYEASQIRSAIILTFVLYVLFNEKKISIWFYAFLSTLFHISGLAILQIYIFYFIKNIFKLEDRSSLIFVIVFYSILLIFISLSINSFEFDFLIYYLYSSPINLINTNSLFQILISTLLILNFRKLNFIQKKSTTFFITSLLIFFLLFDFSTIATRIREISLIAFIPLMFSRKLEFNYFNLSIIFSFYAIFAYNLYLWIPRLFI